MISAFAQRPALGLARSTAFGLRSPARTSQVCYAKATEENTTADPSVEITEKAEKIVSDLKEKWDGVEEKPAAIGITVAVFVALYALNGVVNAVDSIPVVSAALELVGLFVSAWFVYRYLIFGPDREELKENIEAFWAKVSGK